MRAISTATPHAHSPVVLGTGCAVAGSARVARISIRLGTYAVTSIHNALNGRVPLIGFSGSPWTLACYMVHGAGSDDYRQAFMAVATVLIA